MSSFPVLANPDGEGHGVAGGAEADGLVGVVHGFGQDGYAAQHESREFVAGEFGGLLAEAGKLAAEAVVFKPTVQGALSDAGIAGRLELSTRRRR